MSGGNLSGVYHFYTMAVTAATMVYIYIIIVRANFVLITRKEGGA